ncbi:MAG: phosphatidylserine decarboxylase family protein [Bacteroidetes bacterium]|nr:phosphatidylserine decarboxylase family protein [Bacteroidota bacterium]
MIAREGVALVAIAFVIGLIVAGLILLIPGVPRWFEFIFVPLFLPGLGLMVAYFFRDPERTGPPDSDTLILAPADGKIVEIIQEEEPWFIGGVAWRISIFLSVLDVHVNRVPVSGIVRYVAYRPGKFRVAWHPKASTSNEQSQIGIEHLSGRRILFKQIAGSLARRIICRLSEGDKTKAGERFGLIRFGSRMDIIFPVDMPVEAKVGDRVRAGVTIIGIVQPIQSESAEME